MTNRLETLCNIVNSELGLNSYISSFSYSKFRKIVHICSKDMVRKFRDLICEYSNDYRFYILLLIFNNKDVDYKFLTFLNSIRQYTKIEYLDISVI